MKKMKKNSHNPIIDAEHKVEEEVRKTNKLLLKLLSKNEDHLLFTGFVILLIAGIIIATLYVSNRDLERYKIITKHYEASPSFILKSTEVASTDASKIIVSGVYETSELDRAFTIPDDQTFLIFKLEITNNTSGEQDLSPVKQLFVRSRDGDYYPMHITSFISEGLPATIIKPSETVSGEVSFAVPKKLADPLLYVDLGWNNQSPVVYDILK